MDQIKKQASMTTENHRAGTVSVTQNQITEEIHKCFAESNHRAGKCYAESNHREGKCYAESNHRHYP